MPPKMVETVSDTIVHYLVHLGEKGITPAVGSVKDEKKLTISKTEGPNLGESLASPDFAQENMEKLYRELGYRVAYYRKICISHGDLRTENVIIRDHLPVIINWEKGSLTNEMPTEIGVNYVTSYDQDSRLLFESTQERLEESGRSDAYNPLMNAYTARFVKEANSSMEMKPEKIVRLYSSFVHGT